MREISRLYKHKLAFQGIIKMCKMCVGDVCVKKNKQREYSPTAVVLGSWGVQAGMEARRSDQIGGGLWGLEGVSPKVQLKYCL